MNWYWVENNERRGPVNDDALESLVSSGRVGPDTLVWREGFAAWTPWRQARPAPAPAPPPPAAPAPPKPAPVEDPDPGKTVALSSAVLLAQAETDRKASAPAKPAVPRGMCTQCRRSFPKDELLRFENDRICAECKPVYLQRLKEGVRPATSLVYAGFWVRFGAKFVDGLILGVPCLGILFLFLPRFTAGVAGPNANIGVTCLIELVLYGLSALYSIWFVGRFGATPGKMAFKLKIVRADGSALTYGRAFGRFFAEMLSGLTFYIGYIMAAFDEENRALHDRICDTRVVRA